MKKGLFVLMLVIVAVDTWGQLDMRANEKIIAQSNYVFLKQGSTGLRVDIKDYRSANLITIELGQSLEQTERSLQQLQDWYKEHVVGESVLLNQDGGQLTIYKASPTLLLVSKASAETCRATYQSIMKTLLIDEMFAVGLIEQSGVIGILTSTDLAMLKRKTKKEIKSLIKSKPTYYTGYIDELRNEANEINELYEQPKTSY